MSVQSFEVIGTGQGRVVRPVRRPALRAPLARPKRGVAPGAVARPASCAAVAPRAAGERWLGVRVALVGLLGVAGAAVAAYGFTLPEPEVEAPVVAVEAAPGWSLP